MKTLGLVVTTLLLTSVMAASDAFVGTWVLNIQRSKYPPGTCPKRMVIEIEATDRGIRYRSDSVYEAGRTAHAQYTADYDGRPAIVTGVRGMLLPVSLKRIDDHTVVASYTKVSEVVATSRRVVSKDGRVMTVTTQSKDESGKRVISVGIFEKTVPRGTSLDNRKSTTKQ